MKGWVAEFKTGMALLDTAIKTQRDDAQKQLDALKVEIAKAQAAEAAAKEAKEAADAAIQKANQTGGVNLTFGFSGAAQPVKISVDDVVKIAKHVGKSWALSDLTPGLHKFEIATLGDPPISVPRVIDIKAGAIVTATIEIA